MNQEKKLLLDANNNRGKNDEISIRTIVVAVCVIGVTIFMFLFWLFVAPYLNEKSGYTTEDIYFGSCEGAVRDMNFEPLDNSTVLFYRIEDGVISGVITTDEYGEFDFSNIPIGTYNITASKKGYKSKTIGYITISRNEVSYIYFNLEIG